MAFLFEKGFGSTPNPINSGNFNGALEKSNMQHTIVQLQKQIWSD
jgi:hypothetical protein